MNSEQFKAAMVLPGLFGFVLLCIFPSVVLGETGAELKASLVPSHESNFRKPAEPIEIVLPKALDPKVYESLVLELDSMAVDPEFVELKGHSLIFTPPYPMEFGAHDLRLVQNDAEGNSVERGVWDFEVRKTEWFQEAAVENNFTLEGSWRGVDHGIAEDVDRFQGNGANTFRGSVANEDWQAEASANVWYNSRSNLTPTDRELDIETFNLIGKSGPAELAVGENQIAQDNLVMGNIARRGVFGTLNIDDINSSVTGFSMRTEPIAGISKGLGIHNDENRLDGVYGQVSPFSENQEALTITSSYVNGNGQDQAGLGVGGDGSFKSGNAWNVAVDSRLFEDYHIAGDYAQSRFDFDGKGTGFDAENGEAYRVHFDWDFLKDESGFDPIVWNVGGHYRRVDSVFRSLANPDLVADRKVLEGTLDGTWKGLGFNFVIAQEKDNVDDTPDLPTSRISRYQVGANYSPSIESENPSLMESLTADIVFSQIHTTTIDQPAASLADPEDSRIQDLTITLATGSSSWNGELSQNWSWSEDMMNLVSDTFLSTTNLLVTYNYDDKTTFSPVVTWTTDRDFDLNVTTKTLNLGLDVTQVFVPNILNGVLNYSMNRDWAEDASVDSLTHTLGGSLSWTAIQGAKTHPGLRLSLLGAYAHTEDEVDPFSSVETFQLFLNGTLFWDFVY